jgi:hypothetical protein
MYPRSCIGIQSVSSPFYFDRLFSGEYIPNFLEPCYQKVNKKLAVLSGKPAVNSASRLPSRDTYLRDVSGIRNLVFHPHKNKEWDGTVDNYYYSITGVWIWAGLQDYFEPSPLATSSSAISKALLNFFLSSSVTCTLLAPPRPPELTLYHSKSSLPHTILVSNP